ncbi:hypothetical protein E9549_21680 [Blastococcus sp. MG754426]|uniref:hypothetical protein n=1 Tax=unclassified Blastococcus TaxID=2619396 RepID=UPI0027151C3F|nr:MULTISPECIES: hypothetical protein [unclassified Blastococcus]MCF6509980.1 hypothetical protein [Blastococcus sp. MG754426]MCF6513379.1 hypothetical protein [Blastococcus sp. MG754427]
MNTTTATRPADLLRAALLLDAAVTGANGAAYLLAAPALADLLGVPEGTLRGLGAFLLVFAVAVAAVAARRPVPRAAAGAVVAANALWAAGSVGVVTAGVFRLTGAGTAWVLLQAAAVAGFAGLQIAGLRRR